ncbi:MAG TPA: 2-oxoglutarate and iron-dependent oxygenase domain-containing protein [Brumimicrobium sp.]|nr:2-oxoglutarate and iron-dependent oxygenase domain-containing protein [Brumimicrobium sp.]
MEFPQYRVRFDNKAFYKITSLTTFEEVLLVGKRFNIHLVHAEKYFEQMQVHEMIKGNSEMYKMSTEKEFEKQFKAAKEYIKNNKNTNNMSTPKGIPSVDLSDFLSDDKTLQQNFINALGSAYEGIGFVAVRNHGISQNLIDKLYQEMKDFFGLDEATKKKYHIEGIGGQRGYTPFGQEHAKGKSAGDLKEFWHFGQFVEDGDPIGRNYPENVNVDEQPNFLKIGKEAYQTFENTGRHLLRAIALHLGLEETYFNPFIHNGNSILRPIHYPPIVGEIEEGAVRAGEHEDINLITLLVGASADGLQVLNKQNEWVSVTEIQDHIVVNVGDMLQRLTNNKLKSTTHRVINPSSENLGTSRYSVPFFLHPRSDMPLNCLPSCIDADHPKAYEDITAGEYLTERLREIGLIK